MSPLGWDIVIGDGAKNFFYHIFCLSLSQYVILVDLPVLLLMAKNPKLFSAVME